MTDTPQGGFRRNSQPPSPTSPAEPPPIFTPLCAGGYHGLYGNFIAVQCVLGRGMDTREDQSLCGTSAPELGCITRTSRGSTSCRSPSAAVEAKQSVWLRWFGKYHSVIAKIRTSSTSPGHTPPVDISHLCPLPPAPLRPTRFKCRRGPLAQDYSRHIPTPIKVNRVRSIGWIVSGEPGTRCSRLHSQRFFQSTTPSIRSHELNTAQWVPPLPRTPFRSP